MKKPLLITFVLLLSFVGRLPAQCSKEMETKFISDVRDRELREKDPYTYRRSIECLGEMRSLAAVNALVDILDFRQVPPEMLRPAGGFAGGLVSLLKWYPAGGALAKIGEPALPMVVEVIMDHEKDSREYQIVSSIFRAVFRRREAEGVDFLEKAAAGASSEHGKELLLLVANQLRQALP